ncbi:MAG: polyribonucleotide nucleotidyltransferase [Oscillospiraceae bacterium]
MFKENKKFSIQFAGRPLTIEVGDICGFANGSCLVRYGDTVIMANAVASKEPRQDIDFFPLSVDFEEKLYSVGKIPGSFFKREGRPSESAILTSRLIDRGIRPLFPHDMRNYVTVTITTLSVDPDCLPEVAGIIGASVALSISNIPWNGPIAGVVLGYANGQTIINPTQEQREYSEMFTTVSGSFKKIVMIESGAKEIPEDVMLASIIEGHKEIKKVIELINQITEQVGKPKFTIQNASGQLTPQFEELLQQVKNIAKPKLMVALDEPDKVARDNNVRQVIAEIKEDLADEYEANKLFVDECLYKLQKEIVRAWLVAGKRVDGRKQDEMRPLFAEVGVLPRVHGSGLFGRGRTQILTIATLGLVKEAQMLDGIEDDESKTYIHHYNFPSYSVGEIKPSRGPGRREVGHGALAERALAPVIPSPEEFPYTIRLVSEVLSSNGSTSQGSVCGSTLALMDAGVPIKEPVAGISCGLICHGDEFMTMVDIQGVEDFFGDMDFKVAGTKNGITAIQVDIKTDGLSYDIIKEAFEKTRKARLHILNEVILKAIAKPRTDLSKFVPKVLVTKIDANKIREVIGAGGKVVQKIVADYGVEVDIKEDGTIFVSSIDVESVKQAIEYISLIVAEPEIGRTYKGRIVKLMPFGAFVEILPGKEGLVHISKFANKRVEKIENVAKEGEEIWVKLIGIDDQGKLILSKKDAVVLN